MGDGNFQQLDYCIEYIMNMLYIHRSEGKYAFLFVKKKKKNKKEGKKYVYTHYSKYFLWAQIIAFIIQLM